MIDGALAGAAVVTVAGRRRIAVEAVDRRSSVAVNARWTFSDGSAAATTENEPLTQANCVLPVSSVPTRKPAAGPTPS